MLLNHSEGFFRGVRQAKLHGVAKGARVAADIATVPVENLAESGLLHRIGPETGRDPDISVLSDHPQAVALPAAADPNLRHFTCIGFGSDDAWSSW